MWEITQKEFPKKSREVMCLIWLEIVNLIWVCDHIRWIFKFKWFFKGMLWVIYFFNTVVQIINIFFFFFKTIR